MDVGQIKAQFPGYNGWNDQAAILADFKATGGSGKGPPDPNQQAQQAQAKYQQGIDTAVTGLQTQKTNLASQYGDLLKTVTGEYQPLINTATKGINETMASRGITNNSGLYDSQMTSGLSPIYGQEAGNAQTIGAGSISDYNAITNAIASMQAGGAGTAAQLPLQYGSLSLSQQALPSAIALATAQTAAANAAAQNIPVSSGGLIFQPGATSPSGAYSSPIQSILQQLGIHLTT